VSAGEAIHNRIHGPGYCDPPCGLCVEVEDLVDDHRAEVLREAQAAVLERIAAWEGMGAQAVALNRERRSIADKLRRMADEATP